MYAHRAILAARCSHFIKIFRTSPDTAVDIVIPDIRWNVFGILLQYVYTYVVVTILTAMTYRDRIAIRPEDAMEVMFVAEDFGLPLLRQMCYDLVLRMITVESVSWILTGAETGNNEVCVY